MQERSRMRVGIGLAGRLAGLAAAGLLTMPAIACSTSVTTPAPSASPHRTSAGSPPAAATPLPGGCASTQVYKGGMPAWLRDGSQGFTGMNTIPYVLAGPTAVAGFLFAYPLQAGTDRTKILWVVSTPRNGAPLEIQIHPSGTTEPVLKVSHPADSGPGEIYPPRLRGQTSPASPAEPREW